MIGHDSGGLIARHALAGDPRVRAWGLVNTEPSSGVSWRFKAFLVPRGLPGFGRALGWVAGKPTLRRNGFVLGDAFADPSLLPVELVWGDQDPFFPLPNAEEMVATFPNAHLTVIEGAGLFSHEERPREVAEALLPVLAGAS